LLACNGSATQKESSLFVSDNGNVKASLKVCFGMEKNNEKKFHTFMLHYALFTSIVFAYFASVDL